MAKENLEVEILDEGNNIVETNGLGCCIYLYLFVGLI